MRVLWVVNKILPAYAQARGLSYSEREGWLDGLYAAVCAAKSGCDNADGATKAASDWASPVEAVSGASSDLALHVAYPLPAGASLPFGDVWNGTGWYGFREDLTHPENYDPAMEQDFARILEAVKPDLVHVFGTEFPHALAALKVFDNPEHTLVGIQGICAGIADAYMADLPEQVQRAATFRDLVRRDSLKQQQNKFRRRAANERALLQLTGHVTGRTDYDRRTTQEIHPGVMYHPMNETLRAVFYDGKWEREKAVPHRIFLPQGDYPLKGFHWLLEALPLIAERIPDVELVVAGNSIVGEDDRKIPLFLRISGYGKYLRQLMERTEVSVRLLGRLPAEKMKEAMLSSGVFVLPSAIENSPNSMGEAMLLGMPVVASDTGGIPSLIRDGKEGLLVKPGDVEGLARAVLQILEEPLITDLYRENARERALKTHDGRANLARLFEIYREIVDSASAADAGMVPDRTDAAAGSGL